MAGYDKTDMTGTNQDSTSTSGESKPNTGNNGQPRRRRPRRRSRRRGQSHSKGQPAKSQSTNNQSTKKGPKKNVSEKSETNKDNQNQKKKGPNQNKRNKNRRNKARARNNQSQKRNNNNNQKKRPGKLITRNETSAGGLVISGLAEAVHDDGSLDLSRVYVALIGRLDRRGRLLWSMPKGHVEAGEQRAATAEREVWEETGIFGSVIEELGVIDYWFVSEGIRIHKTVHHFLLRFEDGELNDQDPEVTEVAWIPFAELIEKLAYADERKLARQAHDLLPALAVAEKAAGRFTPR